MKSSVILWFYSYIFGEISCVSSALHRMSGCTKFTKFFTRIIFRLIQKYRNEFFFSKISIAKVVLLMYYHKEIIKITMVFQSSNWSMGAQWSLFSSKYFYLWNPYLKKDSVNLLILFSVRSSIQKYVTIVFQRIISSLK